MAVAVATDQQPANIPPETPVLLTFCEMVRAEASKYSDWDVNIITAVAMAESLYHECIPTGHNLSASENHGVCVGSYGALQVGCLHYNEGEDHNDLATNIAVAHRVYLRQGYSAWTQYNNGAYREFLK